MTERVEMVPEPQEALTPREARILKAAAVLRWGAILHGVLLVAALAASIVGGLGANILADVKAATLFRYSGSDDTALAITMMLLMIDMSLLLVIMVGLMAREVWALVSVWVLIAANGVLLAVFGYTLSAVAMLAALFAGIIAVQDFRAYRMNPVMLKELRGRMRGMRAFIVLTVYLGLMSGFMALIYLTFTSFGSNVSSAAAGSAGRLLFMGVVGVEMLLIIFIAPAFTSGAITGERERQTFDLLRTTLLASPSFVMGKLESALSYILLLLLAAIPLQSLAFLFGGVSQQEVIIAFVILAVTAIALGTVGIYFSAVAPRTLSASVRTYTVALVGGFGVPFVLGLIVGGLQRAFGNTSPVLNAVFEYTSQVLTSFNPVFTALESQRFIVERQQIGFTRITLSTGNQIPVVSPWISFTVIYLVISAVLLVLTIREMRKVEA
ncbi:MAG: hypothetical protein AAF787_10255 [Chloroflexota bacterium]